MGESIWYSLIAINGNWRLKRCKSDQFLQDFFDEKEEHIYFFQCKYSQSLFTSVSIHCDGNEQLVHFLLLCFTEEINVYGFGMT